MYFTTQSENGQAMTKAESKYEAGAFKKRIGHTVYHVDVYYNENTKETARDKIVRLIKNESVGKAVKKR